MPGHACSPGAEQLGPNSCVTAKPAPACQAHSQPLFARHTRSPRSCVRALHSAYPHPRSSVTTAHSRNSSSAQGPAWCPAVTRAAPTHAQPSSTRLRSPWPWVARSPHQQVSWRACHARTEKQCGNQHAGACLLPLPAGFGPAPLTTARWVRCLYPPCPAPPPPSERFVCAVRPKFHCVPHAPHHCRRAAGRTSATAAQHSPSARHPG